MSDEPLSKSEAGVLYAAGWQPAGGGYGEDGVLRLYWRRPGAPMDNEPVRRTRAEWREEIARIRTALAEAMNRLGAA